MIEQYMKAQPDEQWPVCEVINCASPEDAQKLADILNDLHTERNRMRGELDGMWEHIRNLEQKLLTPWEQTGALEADKVDKDSFDVHYVKPNCY